MYILCCLTRNVGENTTHLLKFKPTLVKELVNEANEIITANHKPHILKKPTGNMTFPSNFLTLLVGYQMTATIERSGPGNRKRTKFVCDTCNVYLHPKDCVRQFHQKK